MPSDLALLAARRKALRPSAKAAISRTMTDAPPSAAAFGARLALRLGLDSLALAHQGQVQPETGRIRHTEALLRAVRAGEPQRPDLVVEDAGRRGLGAPLAYWTALQATEDAKRLFPDRQGRVRLNLQEAQISDPAFLDQIQHLWGSRGEHNPGVDVEIVETARVGPDRLPALEAGLRRLRQYGAHLLLDDWIGSDEDHARLALIRRFAPVTVKLDKSWFSRDRSPERLAYEIDTLLTSRVSLIAEGADEPAVSTLKRHRLPKVKSLLVQAFEYHRPQAVDVLARSLASKRDQSQDRKSAMRPIPGSPQNVSANAQQPLVPPNTPLNAKEAARRVLGLPDKTSTAKEAAKEAARRALGLPDKASEAKEAAKRALRLTDNDGSCQS